MIWLRVFMFILTIYYIMVIIQLITGLQWTSRKITFIRFIVPFYFWFTINKPKEENIAIDTETEGMNPKTKDNDVLIKHNGKWITEKNIYKKIKSNE